MAIYLSICVFSLSMLLWACSMDNNAQKALMRHAKKTRRFIYCAASMVRIDAFSCGMKGGSMLCLGAMRRFAHVSRILWGV